MRFPGQPAIALLSLFLLTQCTPATRSAGSDPFAGGQGSSEGRVQSYDVLLEVVCDRCMVTYQVGPRGEQDSASGSWRERMRLTPLQRTAIRLSATASQGSDGIRGIRIVVDDETVAEAGCASCDSTAQATGSAGRAFTVETVIPR